MNRRRPGVISFVHVGLVVEDLGETVRFLALLGFDCGEPGVFSGAWIDRIIGHENVTVEVVMARAPYGNTLLLRPRTRGPDRRTRRAARRHVGVNAPPRSVG